MAEGGLSDLKGEQRAAYNSKLATPNFQLATCKLLTQGG